jgi:hypothetical protein
MSQIRDHVKRRQTQDTWRPRFRPKMVMAEVAKTNEQGGVLDDSKIGTSHRKPRCTWLVNGWMSRFSREVTPGTYSDPKFGMTVPRYFEFLLKLMPEVANQLYIHHYSSEEVMHDL